MVCHSLALEHASSQTASIRLRGDVPLRIVLQKIGPALMIAGISYKKLCSRASIAPSRPETINFDAPGKIREILAANRRFPPYKDEAKIAAIRLAACHAAETRFTVAKMAAVLPQFLQKAAWLPACSSRRQPALRIVMLANTAEPNGGDAPEFGLR